MFLSQNCIMCSSKNKQMCRYSWEIVYLGGLKGEDFLSYNPFFKWRPGFILVTILGLQISSLPSCLLFFLSICHLFSLFLCACKILWDLGINSVSNVISVKCLIAFLFISFFGSLISLLNPSSRRMGNLGVHAALHARNQINSSSRGINVNNAVH